ncbi:hypothetical protein, partial [Nakamurella sp.]|uniref:hypothetical protein n=1 Tax=Nakamurella sp. TaxID=1869182 RepID=UPI003B3A1A1D
QLGGWLRGSFKPAEGARFDLAVSPRGRLYRVWCGRPHAAEQVSYWTGNASRAAADDAADCRLDAVDALGSTDALDDGSLQVVVVDSTVDEDTGEVLTGPDARSAANGFYVDCLLMPAQPGRELDGPLRGLGDGPVPLR